MFVKCIKLYKKIRICDNKVDSKTKFHLAYALGFQTFFILYCLSGNPLYDTEMFVPYFLACAFTIYYDSKLKNIKLSSKKLKES